MPPKAKRLGIDGVFDIETQDWVIFVLGGCYSESDGYREFRSLPAMVEYMRERGGTWWAHNGGRYDFLALFDVIPPEVPIQCNMAGSRVISARIGKLELRDSYCIAPMRLAQFAGICGERKAEVGLPCECTKNCGGYCAIKREMSSERYALLSGYLREDCRVLHESLSTWLGYIRDHYGEPTGTIGGTSWRVCGGEETSLSPAHYAFARRGYYGGRTEVYRPRSSRGWHDDINSAYVHALTLPMPVGPASEAYCTIPRTAKRYVAEAIVLIDDALVPPLPYRTDNRLYYPTGRLFGVWTDIELRQPGVRVESIGRVLYWEAEDYPYADYCLRGWELRKQAGKSSVLGKLNKSLLVSLAGKLAQRPETKTIRRSPDIQTEPWFQVGNSIEWYYRETFRLSKCANVHHAGAMTAHVRTVLGARLRASPSPVYCDTDSSFSEVDLPLGRGAELGEWNPEGEYRDFRALAPKLYSYWEGGSRHTREKGFPRNSFDELSAGGAVTIEAGVLGLTGAVRKNKGEVFLRNISTRRHNPVTGWIGGRLIDGEATRPPTIDEVEQRERRKR